jgi:hypothetical protein
MAGGKKQVPLRLSARLYEQLAAWAEDDFRSVNSQIEYLLTECVRQRRRNSKYVPEAFDKASASEEDTGLEIGTE